MNPITIAYPVFALLLAALCILAFFVCLFVAKARHLQKNNATLSRIYSELLVGSGKRESELLKERNAWRLRAAATECAADRLAVVVTEYLKDIDDTAALLKDPTPPAMTAARDAIRLYRESIALRSTHAPTPIRKEDETKFAQV